MTDIPQAESRLAAALQRVETAATAQREKAETERARLAEEKRALESRVADLETELNRLKRGACAEIDATLADIDAVLAPEGGGNGGKVDGDALRAGPASAGREEP
ncbi:hypothetical protein KAJ83_11820 [Marivibrio halodurans]|uniref:Uncharacterized protein n=1 Tax=Marivibrio halodurans TaxID=2039722 RepID=A0A8J7S341_9PROT|nr:hypothetical protein [Marivibrio halodurans]MBP5857698.1 hypothetical protein [Marivibrio halodurans]